MVKFTVISLSDPNLTSELRAMFLHVRKLIKWDLTDSSGRYTGLIIVGEKADSEGFQSMAAEFTVHSPEAISVPKFQEMSRIVQNEFVRRGNIE